MHEIHYVRGGFSGEVTRKKDFSRNKDSGGRWRHADTVYETPRNHPQSRQSSAKLAKALLGRYYPRKGLQKGVVHSKVLVVLEVAGSTPVTHPIFVESRRATFHDIRDFVASSRHVVHGVEHRTESSHRPFWPPTLDAHANRRTFHGGTSRLTRIEHGRQQQALMQRRVMAIFSARAMRCIYGEFESRLHPGCSNINLEHGWFFRPG